MLVRAAGRAAAMRIDWGAGMTGGYVRVEEGRGDCARAGSMRRNSAAMSKAIERSIARLVLLLPSRNILSLINNNAERACKETARAWRSKIHVEAFVAKPLERPDMRFNFAVTARLFPWRY